MTHCRFLTNLVRTFPGSFAIPMTLVFVVASAAAFFPSSVATRWTPGSYLRPAAPDADLRRGFLPHRESIISEGTLTGSFGSGGGSLVGVAVHFSLVQVPSAMPEPNTLLLLGSGLLAWSGVTHGGRVTGSKRSKWSGMHPGGPVQS
jgi:hypothetical protein